MGHEHHEGMQAKEWLRILSKYRTPSTSKSLLEIGLTVVPLMTIWTLGILALSYSLLAATILGWVIPPH
jgi:omega-6 fatty acid desaturase (delta-12 desaturase)